MNIERAFLTNARQAPKFKKTGASVKVSISEEPEPLDTDEIDLEQTQKCTSCKEELTLDMFWKDKNRLYGRCQECKECKRIRQRKAYHANPAAYKARSIAWQKANPMSYIACQRRYREANPDKIKSQSEKQQAKRVLAKITPLLNKVLSK